MKDKAVVHLPEVFAPILFYGNPLESSSLDLGEARGTVPLTYTPNMEREEGVVRALLVHVHAYALKDGVSLYAPLYETMEMDRVGSTSFRFAI